MSKNLNLVSLESLAHPDTPNELLIDLKPMVRIKISQSDEGAVISLPFGNGFTVLGDSIVVRAVKPGSSAPIPDQAPSSRSKLSDAVEEIYLSEKMPGVPDMPKNTKRLFQEKYLAAIKEKTKVSCIQPFETYLISIPGKGTVDYCPNLDAVFIRNRGKTHKNGLAWLLTELEIPV